MFRRIVVWLAAVLAILALPASSLAAATIINGSFEAGAAGSAGFTTLGSGSTAIDGWTVTGWSIDWVGSYWTSFDGARSIDLNGGAPGGLSQAVATDPGTTYEVTFELAGNPTCGSAVKTLDVSVDGTSASGFSFDATGMTTKSMGWTQESYAFTATGATTLLAFVSTTSGACGPALDMVSIAEVSTPAALTAADCKTGGWRKMADSRGQPFRNQGDCVSFYATGGRNMASADR